MEWHLHHKAETDSTNVDAEAGQDGDVFTADYQTAGRGRLDHRWLSPRGANLMMSAVIGVEDITLEQCATLPLVVGLAVVRAVRVFLPNACVQLKWPNDVWVSGRKISGILCVRKGVCVIAGIGLNVSQREFASELSPHATSLALYGVEVSVAAVRDRVLSELGEVVEIWRTCGFSVIFEQISAIDYLKGRMVSVRQLDDDPTPIRGISGGIRPDGALDVGGQPIYAGEAHVETIFEGF